MFADLYQETLLDHYRRPRNKGVLPMACQCRNRHASCGDEVLLSVQVEDGVITDIMFEGVGCSISQASLSMMTEAIKGMTVEEARELFAQFRGMIRGAEPDVLVLGDLAALHGVSRLPVRVPCAMLGWETLATMLEWRE